MKKYNVEFSYNIVVEAHNIKDAERIAFGIMDETMVRTDEMNIKITEE